MNNIFTKSRKTLFFQKPIKKGILCIRFSSRNTFFTLYDAFNSTKYSLSNGQSGFKGCTRGTLYASEVSAQILKEKLNQLEFTHLYFNLQGFSRARRKILRLLNRIKIQKLGILDTSQYPHNGCRLKKQRRRKMRRKKL
jgi:small subunit ribosomal protein S11